MECKFMNKIYGDREYVWKNSEKNEGVKVSYHEDWRKMKMEKDLKLIG